MKGNILREASESTAKGEATIFGYYVHDPERFSRVEFDEGGKALSGEEKPKKPKSNYERYGKSPYGEHLRKVAEGKIHY